MDKFRRDELEAKKESVSLGSLVEVPDIDDRGVKKIRFGMVAYLNSDTETGKPYGVIFTGRHQKQKEIQFYSATELKLCGKQEANLTIDLLRGGLSEKHPHYRYLHDLIESAEAEREHRN